MLIENVISHRKQACLIPLTDSKNTDLIFHAKIDFSYRLTNPYSSYWNFVY